MLAERTRIEVRNLAFAYFTPREYPTYRMLQELIQLDGSEAASGDLATRLLPWCADGNYGRLLDGASNISLTGKIAHFELGYIPEAAKLLRAVAGFLITNYTRQHIITMPRRLRKRNVYEEVARLLDIPGGEQIVEESYAQMRRFNCWNISIVQQYSRFKESRIRSAVFGNSRQFFLMRQNDRADLLGGGAARRARQPRQQTARRARAWVSLRVKVTIEDDQPTFDWRLSSRHPRTNPSFSARSHVPTSCSRSTAATSANCSAKSSTARACSRRANFCASNAKLEGCAESEAGRWKRLRYSQTDTIAD